MEVRKFALDYAGRGWPVLPLHSYDDGCCTCGDKTCRSPAKHPITKNGLKDASVDSDVIRHWMDETHDMANIGISTGNGLIVMDIDAKSGGFESRDSLEKSLLEKITASPGINRKTLHKALGGHVQAEAMVNALGKLNVKGKVRSEMLHTGGRPSECWWPVLNPLPTLKSIGSSSASLTMDSANDRTKPETDKAHAVAELEADSGATADCSLVRTEAASKSGCDSGGAASPITLVDLFTAVRDMGGKIVRSDDGFRIDRLPEEAMTPQLRSTLLLHRDELHSIVPNTRTDSATKTETSHTPGDNAEVPAASNTLPRCVKCGEAVVGSIDEYCDPCFQAVIQSLSPEHE